MNKSLYVLFFFAVGSLSAGQLTEEKYNHHFAQLNEGVQKFVNDLQDHYSKKLTIDFDNNLNNSL